MAERLGGELVPLGLEVEIRRVPGRGGARLPVLVGRSPDGSDSGGLLLIGHLDTVLPAIPPRLEGDRLIATGALDMKGGLVTLVGALRELAERGVAPPRDLVFVAVPDEEEGGPVSTSCVEKLGEGIRAMLVLEPGERAPDGSETLVVGRRGLTEVRLRAEGIPAHSGLAYWEGRSALAAAARWCSEAQRLSERGRGPTVNIARLVAGSHDFVSNLDQRGHLLGTSAQLNVVAALATAEGEVRYLFPEDEEKVVAGLRNLARELSQETGVVLELEVGERTPPVAPRGAGLELSRRLQERAAAAGWHLLLEDDRGGVSFPNFLPDVDRATVIDGLGPTGGGMHTRDEWVSVTSVKRRVDLLAGLLEDLAQ